jgi:hypothetical protein
MFYLFPPQLHCGDRAAAVQLPPEHLATHFALKPFATLSGYSLSQHLPGRYEQERRIAAPVARVSR